MARLKQIDSSPLRKLIAATWFSIFAIAFSAALFLRPRIGHHAVTLFVLLPPVAAAISGYLWGGRILTLPRPGSMGKALLSGVLVALVAFAIFAALYALALPLVEHGWALSQSGGIAFLVLSLGLIAFGPWVVVIGAVAGALLYSASAWLPTAAMSDHAAE
jgi:hypothetical protein